MRLGLLNPGTLPPHSVSGCGWPSANLSARTMLECPFMCPYLITATQGVRVRLLQIRSVALLGAAEANAGRRIGWRGWEGR